MTELNKLTLSEIVQNHGGTITVSELKNTLEAMHCDKDKIDKAVNDFTSSRFVSFDGTNISFA